MRLSAEEQINHPPGQVFTALRDKAIEMVPFMPNVSSIDILERRDTPPATMIRNRWQGSSDDVAKVIRPFISAEMMAWIDEATWNEETLSCTWTIESLKAKGIFECAGTTELIASADNQTVFRLGGDLTVHAEKVPGVPGFLAKRVRAPLENFVVELLRPNLTQMARAVEEYLSQAALSN